MKTWEDTVMKTARKWISLILMLALALSLTLTSASADTDAIKDARNGVVRIVVPYQNDTGNHTKMNYNFFCKGTI